MLRQRQLLLKKQRELVAGSFGVVAQDDQVHAPTMPNKGNHWAQFLIDVPERPNSEGRAPSAGGVVKVVVGRPGSWESEAEAFDPQTQSCKPQSPRAPTPPTLLERSLVSCISLADCVQLDCSPDPELPSGPPSKPEQAKEGAHGWDLRLQGDADSRQQSKEKPQGRRPFWSGWGARKSAHFAEEEEEVPSGAVSAFSVDAEGWDLEEDASVGPAPAHAAGRSRALMRAQTPWPAQCEVQEGLPGAAADSLVLPGAPEDQPVALDGECMRRHAQDPFDMTGGSLDLDEN